MKKVFLLFNLFFAFCIASYAQHPVQITNNSGCPVQITLYAHSPSGGSCGDFVSNPFLISSGVFPLGFIRFSNLTELNPTSGCTPLPSGLGTYSWAVGGCADNTVILDRVDIFDGVTTLHVSLPSCGYGFSDVGPSLCWAFRRVLWSWSGDLAIEIYQ